MAASRSSRSRARSRGGSSSIRGPANRSSGAQRIGIILFGSRVDLFVPDGAEVLVRKGEKVRAGLTGLAQWPPPAPGSGGRPPARA